MSLIIPTFGMVLTTSSALLTSFAILITNQCISKYKKRFTKLKDWIIVIILLNEQTLKESMIDKKTDLTECEKLKNIYHHYLDKGSEIMKNTQFKVEDVFGDLISKIFFSTEQKTKLKIFSAKLK